MTEGTTAVAAGGASVPPPRSGKASRGGRLQGRQDRRRRLLLALIAAYPGALVALTVAQLVVPSRSGPLALSAVVAPYLFLPVIATLPLLLLRGAVVLRLAVALCLLCGLWFAPRPPASSATADPPAATLTVMTWNVALGHGDPDGIRRLVESRPADIVALEEDYNSWWDPDYTRWQEREAALSRVYPHQIRYQHGAPQGLTILSVYPILDHSVVENGRSEHDVPPVAWGRFDLGQGRTVVVAAAHPRNPIRGDCTPARLCYATTERDAQVAQIRAAVAPFLARGEPLLLVGDFNLTDREPAYRDLAAGLWDAYRVVGSGMGHTWRPFPLAHLDVPLLRIDYLLGSPAIRPLRLTSDCTPRGTDHCALLGSFAVP